MRRAFVIILCAVGLLVATTLPADAAWGQTTNSGRAGYVTNVDWRGAEGGVCGDPKESISCPSSLDQVFVNKHRAYSDSYAVTQTISTTTL